MGSQKQIILVVSGFVLAILACSLPQVLAPSTISTPEVDTPTPSPTPTPLRPLPPTLVETLPLPGEELHPEKAVTLYFDQPMDKVSVEAAFQITPSAAGGLRWIDSSTVQFQPSSALQRNTEYTLSIGQSAKSQAGLALAEALTLPVSTAGYLEISHVSPAPGTADVAPDTAITVIFNRPVVPLELEGDHPQPLSFDPPIKGEGEWIDTSIFTFRASQPLPSGATLMARVEAGLQDINGGILQDPYTWNFSTSLPKLLSVEPEPNAVDVPLDAAAVFTFSQRMERTSTEKAFQLFLPDGNAVDGSFSWNEKQTELTFTPADLLAYNQSYSLQLIEDALSMGGTNLVSGLETNFYTVKRPAVLSSIPSRGGLKPYDRTLTISFSSPMDEASLVEAISISPEVENFGGYWHHPNRWIMYGNFEPRQGYTLTLAASASDPFGTTLEESFSLPFTTGDNPPQLDFSQFGEVLTLAQGFTPKLEVQAANINRVDFKVYRLTMDEFFSLLQKGYRYPYPTLAGELIRQNSQPIQAPLNQTQTVAITLQESPLESGPYLFIMSSPQVNETPKAQLLLIRDIELVMKTTLDRSFIWAVDLSNTGPVSNRDVRLLDQNGAEIGTGKTNSEGIVEIDYPEQDEPYLPIYAQIGSPGTPVFGLSNANWANNIQPYYFGIGLDIIPETAKTYLYTDRPIYRPSHSVRFRGIIRELGEQGYALPAETNLPISLIDPSGETISTKQVPVSAFGTFSGEFPLSREASLGTYRIEAGNGSVYFDVAAYRKPEFTVSVVPSLTDAAIGDAVTAEVQAAYFFGGPVANAEVEWTAYPMPTSLPGIPRPIDWFAAASFEFPYYSFEPLARGKGTTNREGKIEFEIPTTLDKGLPARINIQATITDSSGLPVTGEGSFNLHPAEIYLSLIPESYALETDEEAIVRLRAHNWASDPIAGQAAVVEVERVTWKQVVGPSGRVEWKPEATLVNHASLTTSPDGSVLFSFEPEKSGTYRVRAVGVDQMGREALARATLWVSGPEHGFWRQPRANRLALVPDKERYAPGQVAKILIPSPFQEPTKALITVERESVLSHKILSIRGSDSMVEIPIETAHAPNIFVSVVLIRPGSGSQLPSLAAGFVELPVSAQAHKLNVTLDTEHKTAYPGETITYELTATDADGLPVQAEFSFALVDLAALSLADPNSPSPFESLYAPRPLAVRTGASLSLQAVGAQPGEGGNGRGGGGGEMAQLTVRSEFPDTAFWNASVVTDEQGKARVSMKLPDSLTTWHLDVRGVTEDTKVGSSTSELVTTKELLIRPITPRFFTAGDSATVGAVIHNNTEAELPIEVWLSVNGAQMADQGSQSTMIAPGGQKEFYWNLLIQDVPGVDLTFYVSGRGLRDASKPTVGTTIDGILPVRRFSAPETAGTAGVLDQAGERMEAINLPRRFEATQGQLSIRLDPTLGAAMKSALQVLDHAPYASTEQLITHFLPNLVTLRALQNIGLGDPNMENRLEETLQESLQTLLSRQNSDGGWGWWKGLRSDQYLTAYALYALSQARESGASVSQASIDSAIQYLQAGLAQPGMLSDPTLFNRQSFVLYALASAGEGNPALALQMVAEREGLSLYARALLANTLAISNPDAPQIQTLLADLETNVVRSATGAHWQDEITDRFNLGSPVRTTAHALQALLTIDPENPLIPNTLRWLFAARSHDGTWRSSHETAWALISIADWLETSGSLQAAYQYSMRLNGQQIASGSASPEAQFTAIETTTPIEDLFSDQPNQLSIRRDAGGGSLFYTAHLTVYRPVEDIIPTSRGLSISHQYFRFDGDCGAVDNPCPAAETAHVGDDLLVRVTLVLPSDQYYLAVEDSFPAGVEPIDTSLRTTPSEDVIPNLGADLSEQGGWRWWYFSHAELGDNRLRLFADFLPAGTYQYTYLVHALLPGEYRVIPPRAWAVYFPEVYGQGAGQVYTIQP